MHVKKIITHQPLTLISQIRNMEKKLVNVQMISRMHDTTTLIEQVRILITLLDISRKYNLLGYTAKAVRSYIRVLKVYERIINT